MSGLTDAERRALLTAAGPQTPFTTAHLTVVAERIIADRLEAQREGIARAIEAQYLGPDSGRSYDGQEAPDAHCRNAFDEGLELAARIAREATS